mmetsp:Transcript_25200/g.58686  ORF Transcript_25200/g.58686 Transcript_25200/m.58686 type:complete len:226 (+) Transcript_25200:532-1209(+)
MHPRGHPLAVEIHGISHVDRQRTSPPTRKSCLEAWHMVAHVKGPLRVDVLGAVLACNSSLQAEAHCGVPPPELRIQCICSGIHLGTAAGRDNVPVVPRVPVRADFAQGSNDALVQRLHVLHLVLPLPPGGSDRAEVHGYVVEVRLLRARRAVQPALLQELAEDHLESEVRHLLRVHGEVFVDVLEGLQVVDINTHLAAHVYPAVLGLWSWLDCTAQGLVVHGLPH